MAPEWQCPSCQSAYNKVNNNHMPIKPIMKAKRRKIRRKREEAKGEIQQKIDYSAIGISAGIAIILKGTATVCKSCMKACVPSAGSPLLMVIGGVVLVASIGYLVWNYLSCIEDKRRILISGRMWPVRNKFQIVEWWISPERQKQVSPAFFLWCDGM